MKSTFLYADSGISPHYVHKTWAMSICNSIVKTPMGIGKFDINIIPDSDLLIIESLYCLPFAKKYKKKNPNCKIVAMVADTSFWKKRLSLGRRIYYKLYMDAVDGFIAVSNRIKTDIKSYINKPVVVVRPFLVNKHKKKLVFNKNILFIGNDSIEKGFNYAIEAVEKLPEFELFLVGTCSKKAKKVENKNIHIEGKVTSLKKYLDKCTYYIHPADFDPSPVVVWEAMYAGLIPIVTNDIGQSEVFTGRLGKLILKNNQPETVRAKILELDNLSKTQKKAILKNCKKISVIYTEKNSVKDFKKSLNKLLQDL